MTIPVKLKTLVKHTVNKLGFDILMNKNSPRLTLCGLKTHSINTVIDIGANEGQFARYISTIFPNAKIHCFEPQPEPYASLESWATSQSGRVKIYNMAVGEEEGTIDMHVHVDFSPSSSLLATTDNCTKQYPFTQAQKKVPVKLSTLDAQFQSMGFAGDILVKMDVQGYEDRVIRGGGKTLEKATACILEVCLDKLYENQADFKELLLLLDSLHFRYAGNLDQSYAEDGRVIYFDAVFVKS